jgi:hypothetical protein
MVDNLVDRIYQEMSKKTKLPIPESVVKQGIEAVLASLDPLGMSLAYHRGERVKIEPGSFFCPHCGKHQPPLGFNGAAALLPGFGSVEYIVIFCGEESCRKILQIAILKMALKGKALDT